MAEISNEISIAICSEINQHVSFSNPGLLLRKHEIIHRITCLIFDSFSYFWILLLRAEESETISLASSRKPFLSDSESVYF